MNLIYNGMPASQLAAAEWQKSTLSTSQGNCMEFARLPGNRIAVRNSRYPNGPALIYTQAEIAALVQGAKDGEFDNLVG
ncbi:MAG: DUF397 domain-containing protein [Sporichthyaceae bacterium]|nr:DUF397 domain-containing protein [Sporichthyaceae bacterium]